jgi:hypothetical protein
VTDLTRRSDGDEGLPTARSELSLFGPDTVVNDGHLISLMSLAERG